MSALRDAALGYAARGWQVFPLQTMGKKPMVKKADGGRGYLDATTDHAQITNWWSRWPEANIGLACAPSGMVALDVDGPAGVASLQAHPGPVPVSLATVTARGFHLLYSAPEGRQARPSAAGVDGWTGLDVRSNGYVVMPPSVHPSGHRYRWDRATAGVGIVAAPEWLLYAEPEPRPVRRAVVELGDAPGTRYGVAALRGLLVELAGATQGSRHDTLYRVAVRVAELVAAGHVAAGEARRRVEMAAAAAWAGEDADHEITRAIADAWVRGGAA